MAIKKVDFGAKVGRVVTQKDVLTAASVALDEIDNLNGRILGCTIQRAKFNPEEPTVREIIFRIQYRVPG